MGFQQGSHWGSTWISCYCPIHEDPAVLDLYVCPLHMFQQLTDTVYVGVSQLIALVLGLGGNWVGQLTSFPSLLLPT